MNKQTFAFLITLFLVAPTLSTSTLLGQGRPNVVLMLTDDQGYGDLGLHGNPYLKTERLAQGPSFVDVVRMK